jgi:hypothetical protein
LACHVSKRKPQQMNYCGNTARNRNAKQKVGGRLLGMTRLLLFPATSEANTRRDDHQAASHPQRASHHVAMLAAAAKKNPSTSQSSIRLSGTHVKMYGWGSRKTVQANCSTPDASTANADKTRPCLKIFSITMPLCVCLLVRSVRAAAAPFARAPAGQIVLQRNEDIRFDGA